MEDARGRTVPKWCLNVTFRHWTGHSSAGCSVSLLGTILSMVSLIHNFRLPKRCWDVTQRRMVVTDVSVRHRTDSLCCVTLQKSEEPWLFAVFVGFTLGITKYFCGFSIGEVSIRNVWCQRFSSREFSASLSNRHKQDSFSPWDQYCIKPMILVT